MHLLDFKRRGGAMWVIIGVFLMTVGFGFIGGCSGDRNRVRLPQRRRQGKGGPYSTRVLRENQSRPRTISVENLGLAIGAPLFFIGVVMMVGGIIG